MTSKKAHRPRVKRSWPAIACCSEQEFAILRALERDARMSFSELGDSIGISKSPSWMKVRALEARGAISGFRAVIEPAAIGLQIHAFVLVTIQSTMSREFESAVLSHVAVLECHTIAGQADYFLHVLVPGIADLDALLRNDISRMPGVEHVSTTVGLKTIKSRGYITDCVCRTN